ncbi:MAG: SH3 domain-containing protein [Anaerolineales bacterium]|nr:SH3 domain-containing protein [Anaerolineales bacterium]
MFFSRIKLITWLVILPGLAGLFFLHQDGVLGLENPQEGSTPQPGSEVYVTVIYDAEINVRSGPSTVLYDVIGHRQPGDVLQAVGVSPGQDWVQIVFPEAPNGLGWVHTSLISVPTSFLNVVEPPPTATPLATATFDPTLVAEFVIEPTVTRMPTFTPAPALEIPSFPAEIEKISFPIPSAVIIAGLASIGLIGFLISLFVRR